MKDERYVGMGMGIFLVGLGLIFLLPGVGIWPWILVVIGLAELPPALAAKRSWEAWQSAFWLIGLALLFWSGYFWPGILIMIGLSTLLGALLPRSKGRASSEDGPDDEDPFAVGEPLFEDDALKDDSDEDQERRADNGTRRL